MKFFLLLCLKYILLLLAIVTFILSIHYLIIGQAINAIILLLICLINLESFVHFDDIVYY